MNGNASASKGAGIVPAVPAQVVRTRQHRAATYQKVRDERKRPIRGLWVRNDRYYAQLTVEDPHTGHKQVRRVPLEGATTPAQAKSQLEDLLVTRRKGHLPVLKRTPTFSEFAAGYIEFYRQAKDAKRASTMETEQYAINQWKDHLGSLRLGQIKRIHVDSYIAKRQGQNKSARTVNLEVTVFRNVMNRAIDQKLVAHLPTENLRPLKSKPRKRQLVLREQIDQMLALCQQPIFTNSRLVKPGEKGQSLANAREFADYLRLLCFSGARKAEATRLRWDDVDWKNRHLTIGSDGEVKNRKWRVVDFNPELERHLKDMFERRPPDSDWLFPSPRRGEKDRPIREFRESLDLVRQAASLPKFGFHDCRHFFISMCVMSGIDFMTIARWVGHQDGGILVGKVYGHLSNEHAKRQAARIDFGAGDFFDEQSLVQANQPIFEGAIVKFQADIEQKRPKMRELQLEPFAEHNFELDFVEEDFLWDSEREWFSVINNPDNPVANYLSQLLSLDSSKYYGPGYDRDRRGGLPSDLEWRLNEIIGGPLLYDRYLFAKIRLRKHTELLLKRKPKGFELRFLNKLLLEDALKNATKSKIQFPDSSAPTVQAEVVELEDVGTNYAHGTLKTPYKRSRFYYSSLPSDEQIPSVGSMVQCRIFAETNEPELVAYDVWELPSNVLPQKTTVAGGLEIKTEDKRGRKEPVPTLSLPIRFDWAEESLISSNRIPSPPLPPRFAYVLKGWFGKNPLDHRSFVSLSYLAVAKLYSRGLAEERVPNISEQDIKIRLKLKEVAENSARIAQQFARDFSRWLKQRGIQSKALFDCDRKSRKYYLVSSGWHSKKPVVNNSEPTLKFKADPEIASGKRRADETEEHSDESTGSDSFEPDERF